MSENLNEIEAPACPEGGENYTSEMGELWACPMCGHDWERTAAGETEEAAGSKVLDIEAKVPGAGQMYLKSSVVKKA